MTTEDLAKPYLEAQGPRQAVTSELQEIVDRFNKDFAVWAERTGCVANFGWKYTRGKQLEVLGIDLIVFRKDAPTAQNLADVMKAYEPKE